jgi:hypothetical protein
VRFNQKRWYIIAVAMKQKKITQKVLNRALAENGQPAIEFAKILLPGETISDWMEEFRKVNQGGYLLNDTKTGMRGNDQKLIYGSSKQAVENQNIINIYDALVNGGKPKIVNPKDFQEALTKNGIELRLTRATGADGRNVR